MVIPFQFLIEIHGRLVCTVNFSELGRRPLQTPRYGLDDSKWLFHSTHLTVPTTISGRKLLSGTVSHMAVERRSVLVFGVFSGRLNIYYVHTLHITCILYVHIQLYAYLAA